MIGGGFRSLSQYSRTIEPSVLIVRHLGVCSRMLVKIIEMSLLYTVAPMSFQLCELLPRTTKPEAMHSYLQLSLSGHSFLTLQTSSSSTNILTLTGSDILKHTTYKYNMRFSTLLATAALLSISSALPTPPVGIVTGSSNPTNPGTWTGGANAATGGFPGAGGKPDMGGKANPNMGASSPTAGGNKKFSMKRWIKKPVNNCKPDDKECNHNYESVTGYGEREAEPEAEPEAKHMVTANMCDMRIGPGGKNFQALPTCL